MQTLHCIVSKPFFVSLSHHVTRMKGSGNCGVVSVEGVKQKAFFQLILSGQFTAQKMEKLHDSSANPSMALLS